MLPPRPRIAYHCALFRPRDPTLCPRCNRYILRRPQMENKISKHPNDVCYSALPPSSTPNPVTFFFISVAHRYPSAKNLLLPKNVRIPRYTNAHQFRLLYCCFTRNIVLLIRGSFITNHRVSQKYAFASVYNIYIIGKQNTIIIARYKYIIYILYTIRNGNTRSKYMLSKG